MVLYARALLIESITDQLKNVSPIGHTGYLSPVQSLHQSDLWADYVLLSTEEAVVSARFAAA